MRDTLAFCIPFIRIWSITQSLGYFMRVSLGDTFIFLEKNIMKRRLLVIFLSVCCILCLSFCISACTNGSGSTEPDDNAIQEHVHDWGEWEITVYPDCETQGEITRTCKTDSTHKETQKLNARGHAYGEWTVTTTATCSNPGEERRICKNNSEHVEKREIEQLKHTVFKEWSSDDKNHWHGCATCDEKFDSVEHSLTEDICTVCERRTFVGTEGIYYVAYYGQAAVYGIGEATDTDIVIAKYYDGLPVTTIGTSAFWNCTNVTSITLPETITEIRQEAFDSCTALKSINLPEGLTVLGSSAFAFCHALESINIPKGITYIGNNTFYSCSSLASVFIGSNVTKIGDRAFWGCDSLASVTFGENSKLVSIGSAAFVGCSFTEISIPSGVTSIADFAFHGCTNLLSITLPEGVTVIEDETFSFCHNLESVSLHDGITYIGRSAFENCVSLKSITLPVNVTVIEYGTFSNCEGLESVVIFGNVTEIGNYAFSGCGTYTLPCRFYYFGTEDEWARIEMSKYNGPITNSERRYYYSEEYPFTDGVEEGNFWHYENDEIVVWSKAD